MKKILFFGFIIIALFIIKNLAFSIYDIWQKKDVLEAAKKELESEKRKNLTLKSELSLKQSQEFIEEEARNKLFLSKTGESEVVLPHIQDEQQPQVSLDDRSNLEKWQDLFF